MMGDYEMRLASCCICLNILPQAELFLHAPSDSSSRAGSHPCVAITCKDCTFRTWEAKTEGNANPAIIDCPICKESLFYNERGHTDQFHQKLFANSLVDRNPSVTCAGCSSSVQYAKYGEHLASCEDAQIPCPFGCQNTYTFGKLRKHYSKCTGHIKCKCPCCFEMVQMSGLVQHVRANHDNVMPGVVTTSTPTIVATPMLESTLV
mmetsp:Transcript_15227/g.30104  ORF Transcript_15227/g.30104 Transcript_15227/m.30104 type:complete len:206 (+) Transcript_15227:538-1155(+)